IGWTVSGELLGMMISSDGVSLVLRGRRLKRCRKSAWHIIAFFRHGSSLRMSARILLVRPRDDPKRRTEDTEVNRFGYGHSSKSERGGGAHTIDLLLKGLNCNGLAEPTFKELLIDGTENCS